MGSSKETQSESSRCTNFKTRRLSDSEVVNKALSPPRPTLPKSPSNASLASGAPAGSVYCNARLPHSRTTLRCTSLTRSKSSTLSQLPERSTINN
ncbi:MAG: hypothetical protein QXP31_01965 [Pyrobaculum sp.]